MLGWKITLVAGLAIFSIAIIVLTDERKGLFFRILHVLGLIGMMAAIISGLRVAVLATVRSPAYVEEENLRAEHAFVGRYDEVRQLSKVSDCARLNADGPEISVFEFAGEGPQRFYIDCNNDPTRIGYNPLKRLSPGHKYFIRYSLNKKYTGGFPLLPFTIIQ